MKENPPDAICEFCTGWIDVTCPDCGITYCSNCDAELHDEFCGLDEED